jgi:hypothetical protein
LHSGAIGEHWSRELNSVQKWLLLALLIGAMYPASAQVTPELSQLSQELVSARIQTLREAGSQEGSDATLDNYAQVLNWLGEAQAHAAAEKNLPGVPDGCSQDRG